MPEKTLLIFTTCPDLESAERIAGHLVDEGLAACIQITAPVTSVYIWQGQRESAEERVLQIKTGESVYKKLEQRILSLHPYELPEIIAVGVEQGLPGYLEWVHRCTKQQD
ncbi:MAG: divalent-cation tolerance protein CutA [Chromatiales bacterium]|nr:divalent-cation tolerance protein CutA [Chromatiales bacterium]